MPRGHQYHQPNAPDDELDDSTSDLDLDLDELGPSEHGIASHTINRQAGVHVVGQDESNNIPLSRLRNGSSRLPGRRAKRFESNTEEDAQNGLHTRDGSISNNVGDATPLLAEDDAGQTNDVRARRGVAYRLGLLGLRSRRVGYQNLIASVQESEEVDNTVPRTINPGQWPPPRFPANTISNAKYTPWSFLPRTLYNEFSFFINLYFLIVALSQLIPPLRIGVLWTYMVPLAFVLCITLGKEAYDDVTRRKRDGEANRELYTKLRLRGPSGIPRKQPTKTRISKSRRQHKAGASRLDAISEEEEETGSTMIEVEEVLVKSKDIKVGDVLKLGKNDRVPADVVILKSLSAETSAVSLVALPVQEAELLSIENDSEAVSETQVPSTMATNAGPAIADGSGVGEAFIRTDQLDGETDWKLRVASPLTQSLHPSQYSRLIITAGKPSKKVNEFLGRMELSPSNEANTEMQQTTAPSDSDQHSTALSLDNTAWANTVLASNATVLAVVVYTGSQTRQALSTAPSRSKVGLLELEINNLTKILCLLTITLSAILVGLQAHFNELNMPWYVSLCRFLILFSSIIPISLRVNLDIGKTVYAYNIHHDKDMPEAVVRTSTIPEDLGRIEYLLSDKTGTLTQNGLCFTNMMKIVNIV